MKDKVIHATARYVLIFEQPGTMSYQKYIVR